MTSVGVMASAVGVSGDVLLEPFNNLSAWAVAGVPPATIVAGRTGTAVQIVNPSGTIDYTIPPASESADVTVGFAWRTDTIGTQPQVLGLRSDAGVTMHVRLRVTSAGALQVRRDVTTLGTSATGLVAANTWYYIELRATLHDTTGLATVRLNGTTVLSLTNVDTKNAGTKTVFDTLRLESGVTGTTTLTDDLYLNTGITPFKGDITIP